MDHQFVHTYSFHVDALHTSQREEQIRNQLRGAFASAAGVQRVGVDLEARTLTIDSTEPLDIPSVKTRLATNGFHLQAVNEPGTQGNVMKVCVDGMTCQSCEVTIERRWKKLPGVRSVDINATTGKARIMLDGQSPSIAELQEAIGEGKYIVSQNGSKMKSTKPSFWQLVGVFALVLLLGKILTGLGLFKTNLAIGAGISFGAIFAIGLVAASSSCIAVVGGLLLSSAAKFNERYGSAGPVARMRPVFFFILGRIIGYTILGGLLGVVGKVLAPSPLVTAIISIAAAVYMLTMGLDMLQIAPAWLKKLTPKMPKALSHRVLSAEEKEHPLMPILLGAATFFLPCGFTQALQLYALSTGNFVTGAMALLAFSLGTAPALFALGWASSSLKGKAGRFFFTFSGALVVVLGLWNIQNGLAIAGYPISLPTLSFTNAPANAATATDLTVTFDGQTQVMKMEVDAGGYSPNRFTIKAGAPTRWEITGTGAGGCANSLVSRQLGIQKFIQPGQNVVEFTAPTKPGTYQFSCSMGMYRGQITVI